MQLTVGAGSGARDRADRRARGRDEGCGYGPESLPRDTDLVRVGPRVVVRVPVRLGLGPLCVGLMLLPVPVPDTLSETELKEPLAEREGVPVRDPDRVGLGLVLLVPVPLRLWEGVSERALGERVRVDVGMRLGW